MIEAGRPFQVSAVAVAIVAALLQGGCAKTLEELRPFPCADDGSCPGGFTCLPRAAIGDDSCGTARNGACDEPTSCDPFTDTADCGTSVARNDDSCGLSFNGACEEGDGCEAGTDSSDCGPRDDSCQFANDDTCDEPPFATDLCSPGTDSTDCRSDNGGPNSCSAANDGVCDEPFGCREGTDTADCRTVPMCVTDAEAADARCDAAGDCSDGKVCVEGLCVSLSVVGGEGEEEVVDQCALFEDDFCSDSGQACAISGNVADGFSTVCADFGERDIGERCDDLNSPSCGPETVCFGSAGAGFYCAELCDDDHPCERVAGEACFEFPTETYGVCFDPDFICASAPLVGTGTFSGSSSGLDDSVSGSCGGAGGAEIGIKWVVPFSGRFRLDTVGSSFATALYVLRNCNDLSELACGAQGFDSSLELDAENDAELLVIIDDAGGGPGGDFVLNITAIDAFDECSVFANNCFNGDEICSVVTNPVEGFTQQCVPSAQDLNPGTRCDPNEFASCGFRKACIDDETLGAFCFELCDAGNPCGFEPSLSCTIFPTDSYGACIPDYTCATQAFDGTGTQFVDVGASGNDFAGSCGGDAGRETAWTWDVREDGTYELTTIGSGYDTVLYVRRSCGGGDVRCDDNGAQQAGASAASLFARAGERFIVIVDGNENGPTDIQLNIQLIE